MPRIRTLKPDIWADEDWGNIPRESRITGIGVVTQADDEGRLHYRPRIIRTTIFPYDDDVTDADVIRWLEDLERIGFITIYNVNGSQYIQITNWHKHQKVSNASPSKIPAQHDKSLESSRVLSPEKEKEEEKEEDKRDGHSDVVDDATFEKLWKVYPRKVGKKKAYTCWQTRLKQGISAEMLLRCAEHYARCCEIEELETKYILHPSTFLGPNDRWLDYKEDPDEEPLTMEEYRRRGKDG